MYPDAQYVAGARKKAPLDLLYSKTQNLEDVFAQDRARFHVFVAHLSLGAGSPHDPSRAVQRVVA